MASSLEELLAKEGFRGRRSGMTSRASFRAEAVIKSRDKPERDSPLGPAGHRNKMERTRSNDISRYIINSELAGTDSSSSRRRSRDNLVSGRSKKETRERLGHGVSNDVENMKTVNSQETKESEITEICEEEDERVKDIYSDKAYNSERDEKSCEGINGENQRYKERKGNSIKLDMRRSRSNSNKDLLKYSILGNENRKIKKQLDQSYDSSIRSSRNGKNFEDRKPKSEKSSLPFSELAIDEVAIKAIISILNGYIQRFLKDEEFRIMLHNSCFSSLNFSEEGQDIKTHVITNLEQAIEVVEMASEDAASAKDLKKASLQLRMIANLNSNDLEDDDDASGIPNSRLSACAHLYLCVIYKLQKKDKISAKYLLQVFCDSPFSARTLLLPELWEYLFFPHLSHLKVWYNQEADSLLNSPNKIRKLKLLDNVYNGVLDSSTYQFAVYYKDWLTDGIEAPSLPSIHIPTMSVQEFQQEDLQDDSSGLSRPSEYPFSPQSMVSKKLYETVFGHFSKPEICEAEEDGLADNLDNAATNSESSAVEVNQELIYCSEIVKYPNEVIEKDSSKNSQDNTILCDHGQLSGSNQEWKLVKVSVSLETDVNDELNNSNRLEEPAGDGHILNASPSTKENELILKNIAKSVFELQKTEDSGDLTVSANAYCSEPVDVLACYEDSDGAYEYFDKRSFFASIPQDFICPLTGKLFENPVTLESGQTFEQEAIRKWFNKGNRTCPVTGKTLQCLTVPFTNFILKSVIDSWKMEHYRKHESRQMDETTILILEQLLTTFSREERLANAKHLISLGGLEFLIRRIKFGNLEEKMPVAALISCCIDADAGCRNQIVSKIDVKCLLELLHSKNLKSRRSAIFLLTELICRSRRKDVKLFLSGIENEEIMKAMHILLIYLQNSPPEQRPWVAVLLLHLDLLVEPQKFSIYREEAVDAIAVSLEESLADEKIREKSCGALLALGGRFSSCGKSLTETWMLKQAGFYNYYKTNSEEHDLVLDESEEDEVEEESIDEWQRNLSKSLLGNGRRSFLEIIPKCLASGNLNLVKACLTSIAWLSYALSALSDAEFHLSAFSAFISSLKESLENQNIQHKVLASISLLNFSKIPECMVLLMTIAEEIAVPLRSIVEVTWTAKQLYAIISGEYIEATFEKTHSEEFDSVNKTELNSCAYR